MTRWCHACGAALGGSGDDLGGFGSDTPGTIDDGTSFEPTITV